MKNAIIVHGKPSKEEYYNPDIPAGSNFHWVSWLQKQLIVNDIKTDAPEMPHSYRPDYKIWKTEFERFDITPETILVGHSCGGGFLVRWLSENNNRQVKKVVLVAPWIDPDKELDTDFYTHLSIDSSVARRVEDGIFVFNSDDDFKTVQESVRIIRESIDNIVYREFHNYGHFCLNDLSSEVFPELLEEILK